PPTSFPTRRSSDLFAAMRDGARIVNAARGELVDEDALVRALRSGKVGGAALDVFSAEPYSGPLLELDNVVVTPHLAASTDEAQDRAGLIVAEQVAAALEGGLVTNAVNIPAIGAEDLEVLGPYVPLAAKLGRLALGFDLDRELAPLLVLFRYDDVPGVIGRVGTLFGAAQVNIANMTVSRSRRGGKALMVLSVDTHPPADLVARIRAEGFDDARV